MSCLGHNFALWIAGLVTGLWLASGPLYDLFESVIA